MHGQNHIKVTELWLYPYPTWMLMDCRWSIPRSGRFTSGTETRYPLSRKLCVPHSLYGWAKKFKPRTVYPAANRYTDHQNKRADELKQYNSGFYCKHHTRDLKEKIFMFICNWLKCQQ